MNDRDYYTSPFAPRADKTGPTGPSKNGMGFGYMPPDMTTPMPVFDFNGQTAPMPQLQGVPDPNAPAQQDAGSRMLQLLQSPQGKSMLAQLLMNGSPAYGG